MTGAAPPRGIRNNNPGNIDRTGDRWLGMSLEQTDPRFVNFIAPQYGIRAMARLLLRYADIHGCSTVRKLVGRWAPSVENDTSAYVQAVADDCKVSPDAVIEVRDPAILLPLIKAIIAHENGQQPYSDDVLLQGMHLVSAQALA
jgi:hypothetical protein